MCGFARVPFLGLWFLLALRLRRQAADLRSVLQGQQASDWGTMRGPEDTARDAGERLDSRSWVKAQIAYLLSTFPYSEGWVGITWPILQSRGFCTKIGAWVPPRKKIPRPEAEQCLVGNVVSPPVSEFSDGTKRPFCSRMLYQSFASEGRGCCAPY